MPLVKAREGALECALEDGREGPASAEARWVGNPDKSGRESISSETMVIELGESGGGLRLHIEVRTRESREKGR